MASLKGAVRRSQLVTTYGVGALVAVGDESFMVAGTERWPDADISLHEPRLERRLNVDGFREPLARDGKADVPVVRFPRWYSCPKCRRLDTHYRLAGSFDSDRCAHCNRTLVPSRFVVVCAKGHIDDFPYLRWVHKGKPSEGQTHQLFIEAGGTTASLRAIKVSCSCGHERTMEGAFDRHAFRGLISCRGRRPWLTTAEEDCGTVVRALQRGASNVWFGSVRSAISIPPWSEAAFQALNSHWAILRAIPANAVRVTIENLKLADRGFSVDDLLATVNERKMLESGGVSGQQTEQDFRRQEFEALVRGKEDGPGPQQFVAEEGPVPAELRPWIQKCMLVSRLREVRALEGFTRLLPPGYGADVAPLTVDPPSWLPGIEVKGEGVFLLLEEAKIREWTKRKDVQNRANWLDQRHRERAEQWGYTVDRVISPRLLVTHTLAHALINQLSLDAGYPAAALRERLYVFDDALGILIYTATTDSAGSLGGVVAQAAPDQLLATFVDALSNFAWCSTDPVCIESTVGGADALNLAACHACALLPETSCEEMNGLLDRAMLVGLPQEPDIGLFAELLGSS